MRTIDDFKKAAKEKGVKFWCVHKCSMCDYPCGYIINGDDVSYDNGCYCSYGGGPKLRSWQDLVNTYNANAGAADVEERAKKNPLFKKYVEETNAVWGFMSTTP